MVQLTVRNVSAEIVRTPKQRAAAQGRSAEAEHREILREALLEEKEDFAIRAQALRRSAIGAGGTRSMPTPMP